MSWKLAGLIGKNEIWKTSLVDTNNDGLIGGSGKWGATVPGADRNLYGIPSDANHVVRYHPTDTSMKDIGGPDLGDVGSKWSDGIMAESGVIYGIPYHSDQVLKIDTRNIDESSNGNVTNIDAKLPEEGGINGYQEQNRKLTAAFIVCRPLPVEL